MRRMCRLGLGEENLREFENYLLGHLDAGAIIQPKNDEASSFL